MKQTAESMTPAGTRDGRARRVSGELMITLGVLALSLGAVASVARRALFLSDNFADHVAESLADPRVGAFVADRITNAVLQENPDLTSFRPIILATAQGTVSSAPFRALVRATARTTHAGIFSEGGRTVIVSVPDVGVLLKSALANTNPDLAAKVPQRVQALVASIGESKVDQIVMRLWQVARRSAWLALIFFLGGTILAVGGVLVAPNRRFGLVRLGLDLVVAGVVLFMLVPAGRALVGTVPESVLARHAVAGLWDTFTGSLRTWSFVLGASGLVLAAAGHSLLERLEAGDILRRALSFVTDPPAGTRGRALRSVLFLAAGAFTLAWPSTTLKAAVFLCGGCLAFLGLREIFELVLGPRSGGEVTGAAVAATSAGLRVGVVVTLAAVFLVAIAWLGRPPVPGLSVSTDACNGSSALCDRPLDAVVFPTTHNSMASADIPDWFMPQQEKGLPGQLEDGIRGLLLDVHYGLPVGGRVKTDLDHELGSRDKLDRAVGKEGMDAAMRIRDRMAGQEEGPRGPYLCHGFCELGASPFAAALQTIREFLVRNPNEVMVLVLEDYVSPADLAAAFAESGLETLVYKGPTGPPWPTLREMIDTRQRVLVTIESGRTGVPWIHPAFELMQETPYSFKRPDALTCVPNRGGTTGGLFLMNNWVDTTPTPRPSNAKIVNGYDALLARARQCHAERGRRPNLIAVDFYKTGDLFKVVRALNDERPSLAGQP